MPTALDAPPDRLDDHETSFIAQIRKHGWFRTNVFGEGDEPDFSYTTGFWQGLKVPEIIVFSLRSELAHDVLWDVYREAQAGVTLVPNKRLSDVLADIDAVLLPVSKQFYPDFLGWSRWFYGDDDWPCVQLVWPDAKGAFPWETGYEQRFRGRQPNLTGEPWPAI